MRLCHRLPLPTLDDAIDMAAADAESGTKEGINVLCDMANIEKRYPTPTPTPPTPEPPHA